MWPGLKQRYNMENIHKTGLFINFDKTMMLMRFVRSNLQRNFKVIIGCGPKCGNNMCELMLETVPNETIYDLVGAKELLKQYIKILECGSVTTSSFMEDQSTKSSDKVSEVIDLDLEETVAPNVSSDVIILDDSVICDDQNCNISESICIDDTPNLTNEYTTTDKVLHKKRCFVNYWKGIKLNVNTEDSLQSNKKIRKKKRILEELNNRSVLEVSSDQNVVNNDIQNCNPNSFVDTIYICSDDDVVIVSEDPKDNSSKQGLRKNKRKKLGIGRIKQDKNGLKKLSNSKLKINKFKKGVLKEWTRPAHLSPVLTKKITKGLAKSKTVGTNIYNPNTTDVVQEGLRPIVIDGCNVAIGHGKGEFSVRGLQICVEYFLKRGHRTVKVFLPQTRVNKYTFNDLEDLQKSGYLIFTPGRKIDNKIIAPYDDRFIIQYATECKGVVVSSDNFRDLLRENEAFRETIEKRLLMYTWVDDLLMFPQDPLGRNGPTLDEFLRF